MLQTMSKVSDVLKSESRASEAAWEASAFGNTGLEMGACDNGSDYEVAPYP